jgi:predicted transcriptional regulator
MKTRNDRPRKTDTKKTIRKSRVAVILRKDGLTYRQIGEVMGLHNVRVWSYVNPRNGTGHQALPSDEEKACAAKLLMQMKLDKATA